MSLRAIGAAQIVLGFAMASAPAHAQTDEIQVYSAEIAEPGKFSLDWHNNYVAIGRTQPDFPGGLVPNRDLNGVTEFSLGLTPWWELGGYLPIIYSLDGRQRFWIDGAKLRTLFVSPHARERTLFYGCNFEFSYNQPQWAPTRFASEIRTIVGSHFDRWEITLNPILDIGFVAPRPEWNFAPASHVLYHPTQAWAGGIELYEDFGRIGNFPAVRAQEHDLFGVVDYESRLGAIEAGVGIGLTRPGSDPLVFKLILSPSLYRE